MKSINPSKMLVNEEEMQFSKQEEGINTAHNVWPWLKWLRLCVVEQKIKGSSCHFWALEQIKSISDRVVLQSDWSTLFLYNGPAQTRYTCYICYIVLTVSYHSSLEYFGTTLLMLFFIYIIAQRVWYSTSCEWEDKRRMSE